MKPRLDWSGIGTPLLLALALVGLVALVVTEVGDRGRPAGMEGSAR